MICPCSSAHDAGRDFRTRSRHASIHTSEEAWVRHRSSRYMRLSGSTPTTTCTMRHLGRLRIVLQLDERVGHGGEAEGAQTFDGGMNEHDDILINCSNHGRGCWDGREWVRPEPQ